METKRAELLARIAAEHKIIMDNDDPLMAMLTLFEYAIEHTEDRQQRQHKQVEQHMEATLGRLDQAMLAKLAHWEDTAVRKSGRIIDVGLEQHQKQLSEQKQQFFTELEKKLASQQALSNAAAEKLQVAAIINLVAVVVATGLVAITIILA
ncbi:MAG: hypothetical protein ACRCT7_02645 [Shewanella sp.]